jgi:hypothetical protein
MIKTFTHHDLLRFIYNELTNEEYQKIELALLCDNELMEDYKKLKSTVRTLDKLTYEPSNSTLETILNYSKSTNLHAAQ